MEKPLFEWFTILAQIINFLILVVLLKYFLYGRIIKTMDDREQKIKSRLEEADEKKQEATAEVEKYQAKVRDLKEKQDQKLAEMKEEIEHVRKEDLRRSREEVDLQRVRWFEALQQELESFHEDLRQQIVEGIFKISAQVLTDLADTDLQENITLVFLRRLQKLSVAERNKLNRALQEFQEKPVIQSAFDLPDSLRQTIRLKVQELFPQTNDIRFEQNSTLHCGIELKAGGYKIAWTINSYLESLEERITNSVSQQLDRSKFIPDAKNVSREQPQFTGDGNYGKD